MTVETNWFDRRQEADALGLCSTPAADHMGLIRESLNEGMAASLGTAGERHGQTS